MAVGRRSRDLIGPLLVVNFVVCLIVLNWLDGPLTSILMVNRITHLFDIFTDLGGNSSTSFMLIFALIAGVVGACSVLPGLVHLRAWRSDSLAAAGSLAVLSWAITALAFGLVCKEIILGGRRGKRLQILEGFIFISLLSQLLYMGVLHAGVFDNSYGPGYRSYDVDNDHAGGGTAMGHEPQNPGTSDVI